jgi:hypothetical protein
LNVCEPVNARVFAPPPETVIVAAPPPLSDTVPLPATVRPLLLKIWTLPAFLLEVTVPLLVSVLPFTFIVILLFDATVTLALTFVAALVVVVTAPPFRFIVAVPPPADFANVSD